MVHFGSIASALAVASFASLSSAQTFQRLGACPTLGCVFPPDRAEFLPGVVFDVRVEVHAPVNGSEAFNGGVPDTNFSLAIGKVGQTPVPALQFFNTRQNASLERWSFSWFEDLFAQANRTASRVNVASRAYRYVSINEPGHYQATLTYYNGTKTVANWYVLPKVTPQRKAKNVILFIGDGMTTNMITAARLIGHKSVNGKYQRSADGKYISDMAMDRFEHLGHQMTHSLDTFITDSANSATALYTGHKSTVNALNVYADSSPNTLDDPRVETIAELFRRKRGGQLGIVSTAFLADATPAALTAHTRERGDYQTVIESYLRGVAFNSTWTHYSSPDVIFGGGAENFLRGGSVSNASFYSQFQRAGYNLLYNQTSLASASNTSKTLGVFSKSNMAKWLDRNVYTSNLRGMNSSPLNATGDALDQPGLANMTSKAIDILHARDTKNEGFFLMSEAASIDKAMHALDYERALGELLELDNTISVTMKKLAALGILNDTLVITTADHGHGFDVWGSVDTQYLLAQSNDRAKRTAIGTYEQSGQSQYIAAGPGAASGFPTNWDPRYTLAQGVVAHPDVREDYVVTKNVSGVGLRTAARAAPANSSQSGFVAGDKPNGILINGTLPVSQPQGVHSLTDVPVFSSGPGSELFTGVFQNVDVFFKMAHAMELV
jgi:alkaline phosphatase